MVPNYDTPSCIVCGLTVRAHDVCCRECAGRPGTELISERDLGDLARLHTSAMESNIGKLRCYVGDPDDARACVVDASGAVFADNLGIEDAAWLVAVADAQPALVTAVRVFRARLARLSAAVERDIRARAEGDAVRAMQLIACRDGAATPVAKPGVFDEELRALFDVAECARGR